VVRAGFDMPGGWKTFSGQSRHIHQPFSHQLLIPLQGISVQRPNLPVSCVELWQPLLLV
jgi:hypothetical protein